MSDSWTEWTPRMGRPIAGPNVPIAGVRLRDGRELIPAPATTAWTPTGSAADIVAYLPAGSIIEGRTEHD